MSPPFFRLVEKVYMIIVLVMCCKRKGAINMTPCDNHRFKESPGLPPPFIVLLWLHLVPFLKLSSFMLAIAWAINLYFDGVMKDAIQDSLG